MTFQLCWFLVNPPTQLKSLWFQVCLPTHLSCLALIYRFFFSHSKITQVHLKDSKTKKWQLLTASKSLRGRLRRHEVQGMNASLSCAKEISKDASITGWRKEEPLAGQKGLSLWKGCFYFALDWTSGTNDWPMGASDDVLIWKMNLATLCHKTTRKLVQSYPVFLKLTLPF